VKRRRIQFCLRDELAKFEITRAPSGGELTVYAQNARDRFEIDRDAGNLGLYVGDYTPKAESNPDIDIAFDYYFRLPMAGLYVDGRDISLLIKVGLLKVKQLGVRDNQGRVTATLSISSGEGEFNDYRVVFLAERGWLVAEWERIDKSYKFRGVATYSDSALDGRYPKSYFDETQTVDGTLIERREYVFSEPKTCRASDESFTLASYGLAPGDFARSGAKTSLWRWPLLALNALIVVILIVAIWWRLRRNVRISKG
jgi:hypothetical protein